MKKINKILTFLISLCLSLAVQAQPHTRPVGAHGPQGQYQRGSILKLRNSSDYVGVRLGLNSSLLGLSGMPQVKNSARSGMNVAVVYGFRLANRTPLYFEPGLMYTGKGGDLKVEGNRYAVRLHTLEIPFVFKYRIDTNADDLTVQPFLGGFLSLGLGGQIKDYELRQNLSVFQSGAFQRTDGGLRLGCGIQYQLFYAELSYDLGLANIARSKATELEKLFNYDGFDNRVRTRNLSLTVGINF